MTRKLFLTVIIIMFTALGCSTSKDNQFRELSWDEYLDKVEGGWLGQMIGVQFGQPTEGVWRGEIIPFDLNDYYSFDRVYHRSLPEEKKAAYRNDAENWKKINVHGFPENDDVYIELLFLNAIKTYGIDVTMRQVADDWIQYIPRDRVWCANRAAWDNITKGIFPPESGHPPAH